ncbi:MAG TPA: hypothetical protein VL359_14075 [bacterium]|nr:hypothetical protein [bacterium]
MRTKSPVTVLRDIRPSERRINLVGVDALVVERMRASLRRSPFVFLGSDEPLPPECADLYVVPAARVGNLPRHGLPVIAAGPAGLLRSAFLAGCADYLREPWTAEELALRALGAMARGARRFTFPWGELSLESDRLDSPAGPIRLTWHESRILAALLRSRGDPVPRQALGYAAGMSPLGRGSTPPLGRGSTPPSSAPRTRPASRAIDAHVCSIRRKVRAAVPEADPFIVCVRSQGYLIP